MRSVFRFVISFALVCSAAIIASLFVSQQAFTWYAGLTKPDFIPPNWIFGPAWLLVYFLLAIVFARGLTYRTNDIFRRWCFTFGIQLVLSVLWSILFFAFQSLLLSMIDAIALWFTVLILTVDTAKIERLGFWLMLPYLAWATFAMILAVAVWWLN